MKEMKNGNKANNKKNNYDFQLGMKITLINDE